jgi:hypothetical protein
MSSESTGVERAVDKVGKLVGRVVVEGFCATPQVGGGSDASWLCRGESPGGAAAVVFPRDVESGGLVKGFYSGSTTPISSFPRGHRPGSTPGLGGRADAALESRPPGASAPEAVPRACSARIAVYDGAAAAPRIEDVTSSDVSDFIEAFASRVYSLAREAGGSVPYTVVREITENLIHADFREPVASILDAGRTIRFSDQGPGIANKERALQPGFTTASGDAKRFIRGVGSGLPIVQDYVRFNGGSLLIEDNLGSGTVVTIRSGSGPRTAASLRPSATVVAAGSALRASSPGDAALWAAGPSYGEPAARAVTGPALTLRQKQVLALVAESGGAGPSVVAKELMVGVSTAYRDLASLEGRGLLVSDDTGRRTVTDEGLRALEALMAH